MVRTRPATPEDEAFLRLLFEAARAEDFAGLPLPDSQRSALIDMQFRAQRAQYAASFPEASYEIIEADGEAAGNLTVDLTGEEIRLVDINLHPDFRNRGFGKEIILRLMRAGRPIRLHVAATNRARNLYLRLGFVQDGEDGMYVSMRWSP